VSSPEASLVVLVIDQGFHFYLQLPVILGQSALFLLVGFGCPRGIGSSMIVVGNRKPG